VLGGDDDDGGGDSSANTNSERPVIQWDRSPSTVVFRAEVVGGEDAGTIFEKSQVPACTIYGDNRVVWPIAGTDDITQVIYDIVPDAAIIGFIEDLTINDRIYEYDARADVQIPDSTTPVFEQLTVFVNGRQHVTDIFGGWDFNYYEAILNRCLTLSGAPVIFEPDGGWLSAEATEYDSNRPSIRWSIEATNVDLAAIAAGGEPVWMTGNTARIFWTLLLDSTPRVQFETESGVFNIAFQVPNVTTDSPPAPAG
jgi:hypothetical protein